MSNTIVRIGKETGKCKDANCKAYGLLNNWCDLCVPIVKKILEEEKEK